MIKLGDKVTDSVTGLSGTVTARCEYLKETARLLVEPPVGSDSQWIAETRLVVRPEE